MTLKIHQKTVTLKSKVPEKIRLRKGKGLVKTVKLKGSYHSIIEMFEKKKEKTEVSKGQDQGQGEKENDGLKELGLELKGFKSSQDQTTMKRESEGQDTDNDKSRRQGQAEREGERRQWDRDQLTGAGLGERRGQGLDGFIDCFGFV